MTDKIRGVFERPKGSGIWWINYHDAEGRRHREKVGRRKIAEAAYVERQMQVREGRFFGKKNSSKLAFSELADGRMAAKKSRLSLLSYETDQRRLTKLSACFGRMAARNVTSDKIEVFLRTLFEPHTMGRGKKPRPASPSTANRYRALLSSIFSHGVRHGLIDKNPVASVERFREPEGRVRFLDDVEERALREKIAGAHPGHVFEFDLALQSGMRRGEQWGLEWSDIDFENSIAHVNGKRGRRVVRLNGAAKNAILKLHEISNGSPFVSPDKRRAGQRDSRRWFEAACAQAAVGGCSWHTMRHTFVSRLVMAGVDLVTVRNLAGHRSIQTTMRYAHLAPGHEQQGVETIARGWHQNGTDRPSVTATKQQILRFQSSGP